MIEQLNEFVDRLVPPHHFGNARERLRGRLLVYTLLGTALILTLFAVGFLSQVPLTSLTGIMMLAINVPLTLGALGLIYALRRGMSGTVAVHLLLGAAWVCILAGIVTTGGPLLSPAAFALLVPPVIAFKLTDTRGGVAWALIAAGSEAVLVIGHFLGWGYLPFSPEMSPQSQMVQLWVFVFAMVVGFSFFHARSTESLEAELDRERDRLRHMALHDPLTGLANRHLFDSSLQRALYHCERYEQSIALMFIDMNDFKQLNDQFGHESGDAVLKAVAQRLLSVTRESDTVGRLGGDEFALVVHNVACAEDAERIAANVYDAVSAPLTWHSGQLPVAASIGVSLAPSQARESGPLQMLADRAMYRAKQAQRPWAVASDEDIRRD